MYVEIAWTLTRGDGSVALTLGVDVTPEAYRPDTGPEGGEVEIVDAVDEYGGNWREAVRDGLTDDEVEKVSTMALERAQDRLDDARAESRVDRYRTRRRDWD